MRYEYKSRPLSKEDVEKIWKDFYNDNPEVKDALLEARKAKENTQSLIEEIFKPYINSDLAKGIVETDGTKDRLYKYWKAAGLEGSPKEAISKYISANAEKYNTEFISYDYTKPPLDNDRAARNNMLINLIQHRLMDEETFEQRYTPGGFANASKAARFLRELTFGSLSGITDGDNVDFNAIEERAKDKGTDPEPNYDPSDPMTIITYNQQNQVAGKLIGIFANQNTNHAFASLMQAFYLKKPIAFGEHPEGLSDMLHKTDYEAIDLNVAEFLAASVDAVKDPVLNFLNLNTVTADAGAVLARLGYSTRDIGLLFNQPIVKEICEYKFNNGVSTEVAINEIVSQYKVDANEVIPEANPSTDLNSAKLASNIVKSRRARESRTDIMGDNSFRTSQLQVAQLFADILRVSGEISQFVTSSKFTASNAVGSTFGDMYSQQMKVSKYLESFSDKEKKKLSVVMEVSPYINTPINNDPILELSNQEYIERTLDNPFAYEQAMYDMNRRVSKLLSSYYPYDTKVYTLARNRMAELTKSGTLDADTINSTHSDMMVYLLAQQEDSLFNGDIPIPIDSISTSNLGTVVSSYTGNITPDANTIFVFGSNPEGRHGAGAAKIAVDKFGAVYGQGEGLQGNSYAIPTKDLRSKPLYSEDGGKTPVVIYRGYALKEDREAYNIEETIGKTAVDYDDTLKGSLYFTSSKEEAEDYAKGRTDKSPEPSTQENPQGRPVNRHYTGDYAKVSKYYIAADARVEHYADIRDYARNGRNSNADVIILDKGTMWDNKEYIVRNPRVLVYPDMKRSIAPEQIVKSIRRMYETARQNPDKQFKVAYRNTDGASLNGYTGLEMIDMFLKAGSIPSNIVFSKEWVDTGKFNSSIRKSQSTTEKNYVSAREYYTKHFAKILFNTLESNPSYKSLPIFQYMQFEVNEESGEVNANIQDIGGLAPYQKDEIRESWADLMKESPDLARDLFMYNYYKLGFTFSPLAFMNLAPTRVKQAIRVGKKSNDGGKTWEDRTYVDFLNDVLKGNLMDKVDINNFVEQYVRNHTDNRRLVFTPSGTALSFVKKVAIKNGVMQSTFTLDISKLGEEANMWLLSNSDKKVRAFRPFLMIGDTLYMADNSRFGNRQDFNISTCDAIEYRKVSKLGDTNKSLQYLSNSNSEFKYEAPSNPKEGSTAADPEGLSPKVPEFDKKQVVNEIVKEMMPSLIKYGFAMAEEAENMKNILIQDLNSEDESLLQAQVQAIRNAIRENGLIVLDEKGNPKQSC